MSPYVCSCGRLLAPGDSCVCRRSMSAPGYGVRVTTSCLDCVALPGRPRPIAAGCGPRSPRCATHLREHKRAQRKARHDARVVKVYDLAPGEYDELLAAQGGTCAFPRCPASGRRKRLAVDHDHVTGETRGLLCGPHNYTLLGRFAGDLHDALDYLADPPARRLRSVPA